MRPSAQLQNAPKIGCDIWKMSDAGSAADSPSAGLRPIWPKQTPHQLPGRPLRPSQNFPTSRARSHDTRPAHSQTLLYSRMNVNHPEGRHRPSVPRCGWRGSPRLLLQAAFRSRLASASARRPAACHRAPISRRFPQHHDAGTAVCNG